MAFSTAPPKNYNAQATPLGVKSPPVARGRITNVKTRFFVEMMFNPGHISTTDGWTWGEHNIPGASHPIVSGGHGAGRDIKFSVYLDASRGRLQHRVQGPSGNSLDLTREISFWQSFTFPSARISADQLADRGPAALIFTFGSLFPGVRCVMKSCDAEIVQWGTRLNPMRATLSVVLQRQVERSVLADQVFQEPLGSVGPVGDFPYTGNGNEGAA